MQPCVYVDGYSKIEYGSMKAQEQKLGRRLNPFCQKEESFPNALLVRYFAFIHSWRHHLCEERMRRAAPTAFNGA